MAGAHGRRAPQSALTPTKRQIEATTAVVRWYLATYFKTKEDPGIADRFCEPELIGGFAAQRDPLAAGDGEALFRVLVATAMFQRRQDVQIQRILRGIAPDDAAELTSARKLLRLVDDSACDLMKSNAALIQACDLAKDPSTKKGRCGANPSVPCHLKRHTVLLKRYGHFGKVPTSAALMVREASAAGLPELRAEILRSTSGRASRAEALEIALSKAWRINQKIACMFLSAVTNPDLSGDLAAWSEGVDWTRYVVIDSNVDLFLASIRYRGLKTYDARRAFVQALAAQIDLKSLDKRVRRRYNPRLVQQAMYVFMSAANRRASANDCMHAGRSACGACPERVASRCPVKRA